MKELRINDYAILSTDHPASHYGIPVLVTSDGHGFGPSQITYPEKFIPIFGGATAAHSVYSFAAHRDDLTAEQKAFIKLYLGQWPEGPQID